VESLQQKSSAAGRALAARLAPTASPLDYTTTLRVVRDALAALQGPPPVVVSEGANTMDMARWAPLPPPSLPPSPPCMLPHGQVRWAPPNPAAAWRCARTCFSMHHPCISPPPRHGCCRLILPASEPRCRLDAGTWGTMGVGLGGAIGAAVAQPGAWGERGHRVAARRRQIAAHALQVLSRCHARHAFTRCRQAVCRLPAASVCGQPLAVHLLRSCLTRAGTLQAAWWWRWRATLPLASAAWSARPSPGGQGGRQRGTSAGRGGREGGRGCSGALPVALLSCQGVRATHAPLLPGRYRLPIVVLVFNNGGIYGGDRRTPELAAAAAAGAASAGFGADPPPTAFVAGARYAQVMGAFGEWQLRGAAGWWEGAGRGRGGWGARLVSSTPEGSLLLKPCTDCTVRSHPRLHVRLLPADDCCRWAGNSTHTPTHLPAGGAAYEVKNASDLAAACRQAFAAAQPALVDIAIDPRAGAESGNVHDFNAPKSKL